MSTTTTQRRRRPNQTPSILAAMLKTNTGRALCDSGGTPKYDASGKYVGSEAGYGRAFEKNQGVDFEALPAATLKVTVYGEKVPHFTNGIEIATSYHVYHWLKDRLTYDREMNALYERFARRLRGDEHELEIMQEFPKRLRVKGRHVTGLYGEEVREFPAGNTYNGDDALSQVLQYVYFECDQTPYVLLQIHNGADVRGGYTDAKVFSLNNDPAGFLCDNSKVTLIGNRPDGDTGDGPDRVIWESEDAGHSFRLEEGEELWKGEGSVDKLYAHSSSLKYRSDGFPMSTDLSLRGKGVVVVDEENNKVYCPVTGWELGIV